MGGKKQLMERDLENKSMKLIYESPYGDITSIGYSKTGKYICVANKELKCAVIDT